MSARLATAVLAALLVFVLAVPTVGACCIMKPGSSRMAAMHASMPCCAEHCTLTTSRAAGNQDLSAISTPAPDTAVVVVVTIAASAAAPASPGHELIDPSSIALSFPPPFLLHGQFRI